MFFFYNFWQIWILNIFLAFRHCVLEPYLIHKKPYRYGIVLKSCAECLRMGPFVLVSIFSIKTRNNCWQKVFKLLTIEKYKVGHESGVSESTLAAFFVFSDPGSDLWSQICEKLDPDPESLFIFGSSRSLHGLYKYNVNAKWKHMVKTLLNFGCIDGSWIWRGVWFSNLK